MQLFQRLLFFSAAGKSEQVTTVTWLEAATLLAGGVGTETQTVGRWRHAVVKAKSDTSCKKQ